MDLPDELLLEICEYLQPARYEHEAALPELLTLRPSRVAAHDAAAAVKKTSRGFLGLMTRTARVVNGNLYSSYAEFAAEAHPYAEFFQADVDYRAKWVNDDVLGLLHTVMPRLRAVELHGTYHQNRVTLRGVKALMESATIEAYHQRIGINFPVTFDLCNAVAAAPLTTLSLMLGEAGEGDALDALEGHPALKRLSLSYEGESFPPPRNLPNLESLTIYVSPDAKFEDWNYVASLSYPKLKTLVVDDKCGDLLDQPNIFHALTPRKLNSWMTQLPSLVSCHVVGVAELVLHTCTTCHDDERIICYRTPPGVSLTFGPEAFPPGYRVVLDVDTAPLPLAVAVWDLQTITDLDATAVPLGYV